MTHQESLPTVSVWRAPSLNAISRIIAALARPTQSAPLIVSAIIWALAAVAGATASASALGLTIGGVLSLVVVIAEPVPVLAGLPHLYSVPSRGMEPSILSGETVLAWKSDYGWKPNRGDVVIFAHPRDGSMWIKRVVGLPGDKIQVQHGRLIINGEMVPREQIAPYPTVNHFGKPEEAPRYIETLPAGVNHEIIQIDADEGVFDNTGVYGVPLGHYFMMGDNRDNSADSRIGADQGGVGFVPYDNIVAKVTMIAASARPGRVGATVR